MNRDHDDICGVLIPHPDRVARQSAELSDSYVPFEPPQAPGADSINTESMPSKTLVFFLIAGFIAGVVLLGAMVANGSAITSGSSYAQKSN